jgi:ribosomal protein S18 acetylase RimI-like enzyme
MRRARESDAQPIAVVHVKTWQRAYRGLVPAAVLDSLDVGTRERFWQREIGMLPPDRRPWIAESGPDVVGFVAAGPSHDEGAWPSTGEVYAIYVLPECWSRGVGRSLLAHAERDLRAHGYTNATLWVFGDNERTKSFYEAAGWRADGTEKTDEFGGVGLLELRYRKALA